MKPALWRLRRHWRGGGSRHGKCDFTGGSSHPARRSFRKVHEKISWWVKSLQTKKKWVLQCSEGSKTTFCKKNLGKTHFFRWLNQKRGFSEIMENHRFSGVTNPHISHRKNDFYEKFLKKNGKFARFSVCTACGFPYFDEFMARNGPSKIDIFEKVDFWGSIFSWFFRVEKKINIRKLSITTRFVKNLHFFWENVQFSMKSEADLKNFKFSPEHFLVKKTYIVGLTERKTTKNSFLGHFDEFLTVIWGDFWRKSRHFQPCAAHIYALGGDWSEV